MRLKSLLQPPWRGMGAGWAALAVVAGTLLGGTARATGYPESGRPVYLGMGGASFANVDVATGAVMHGMTLGTIHTSAGGAPVTVGWVWKAQDNSAGPFGPGTYLNYDWFLRPGGDIFNVLVAPGNRRFSFDTRSGSDGWIDTRDPEMLGAVLHIPCNLSKFWPIFSRYSDLCMIG